MIIDGKKASALLRKELKETITKLAKIILKKEVSTIKNVEEAHENPEDFKKTASTAS